LFGRDADAGVGDACLDQVAVRQSGDGERDGAGIGELDGVGDEIADDLADAGEIPDDGGGNGVIDPAGERELLLRGDRFEEAQDIVDGAAEIERALFDFEGVGFDLGEVEEIVEQAEEGFAAGENGDDVVALSGIEVGAFEQAGEAEHAVHGRANLVAHGGEEFRFGLVGGFGGFLGGGEGAGAIFDDGLEFAAVAADLFEGDPGEEAGKTETEGEHGHREDGREVDGAREVERAGALGSGVEADCADEQDGRGHAARAGEDGREQGERDGQIDRGGSDAEAEPADRGGEHEGEDQAEDADGPAAQDAGVPGSERERDDEEDTESVGKRDDAGADPELSPGEIRQVAGDVDDGDDGPGGEHGGQERDAEGEFQELDAVAERIGFEPALPDEAGERGAERVHRADEVAVGAKSEKGKRVGEDHDGPVGEPDGGQGGPAGTFEEGDQSDAAGKPDGGDIRRRRGNEPHGGEGGADEEGEQDQMPADGERESARRGEAGRSWSHGEVLAEGWAGRQFGRASLSVAGLQFRTAGFVLFGTPC